MNSQFRRRAIDRVQSKVGRKAYDPIQRIVNEYADERRANPRQPASQVGFDVALVRCED
jgi:hypothetical protein